VERGGVFGVENGTLRHKGASRARETLKVKGKLPAQRKMSNKKKEGRSSRSFYTEWPKYRRKGLVGEIGNKYRSKNGLGGTFAGAKIKIDHCKWQGLGRSQKGRNITPSVASLFEKMVEKKNFQPTTSKKTVVIFVGA